jgi:hypothetical protein
MLAPNQLIWQWLVLLDPAAESLQPLDYKTAAGSKVTLTGHFEEIPIVDPDDGYVDVQPYFVLASFAIEPVLGLWYVPGHQRNALWHGVSPAIDDR